MNILVLGGDGFIGSHLVDRVFAPGHNVTVFDRFQDNVSKNLEHLRGKIRFFSGEFADSDQLARALEKQDIVYHFICATNPASSWDDPLSEIEKNLKNSIRFFELAAACGVKKVVFPSSGGTIYGRQDGSIKEDALPNPFNPYGITKLTTEYFLNYFRERTGIAGDVYRIGNAYGPRQPMECPQGVIAVWMGKILDGQEIQVYGDRETLRDYVYVEDATFLMTHSTRDTNSSAVYNLGTGRGVSILDLFDIFRTVIDEPFKYKIHPRRTFDNTSVVLDSSRLTSFFPGFKFQGLEDKVRDTWLFVKEQHGRRRESLSPNR